MSERDYSLTVRLSPDERAELEALAADWQLDKSATIRHILRMATHDRPRLPQAGHFVTLQPEAVVFPVRLSRKADHDR